MSTHAVVNARCLDEVLGDDLVVDADPEEDARVGETLDLLQRWLDGVFDDPSLLDPLPDGANLVFLPEEDPELAERNREFGIRMQEAGRLVAFVSLPAPPSQEQTS